MNIKQIVIAAQWTFILGFSVALVGCGGSSSSDTGTTATPTPTPTPTTASFRQIERLARPAINEGLVVTNAFLNAYNQIPPSADLSDAAAPVVAEAVKTIDAVDGADGTQNVTTADVAFGFVPDVMRIDTSIASPVGTEAYTATRPEILNHNPDTGGAGAPCAGRKIEDDVMDATLTVLIGAAVSDGVPYAQPASGPGSTNPSIGHHMLHGQTQFKGTATFPFLADPN
jgi:hypothetical protein